MTRIRENSRRLALASIAAFCLGGLAVGHTAGASERSAEIVVSNMLAEMGDLYRTATSRDSISDGLEEYLGRYADIEFIGRATLGVAWRRASVKQRQEFNTAFQRYLAEKYARHLPDVIRGEYRIHRIRALKKDHYEVISDVTLEDMSVYNIRWLVNQRNGKTRIVNLVTNEFNLLSLERVVIRSLLEQRGGNLDDLIAYLPKRYD